MREILFRGKRLDDGEWVEGFLLKRPMNIVFTAFVVYAFLVARNWNRAADKMNAIAEELQKEMEESQ